MPNPKNNVVGEQWDNCDICGRLYPISKLSKRRGMLVCSQCFDDPVKERREAEVSRLLNSGVEQEGADFRGINRAFFSGEDSEFL